mgnify:CR=1 FL=1
MIDTNLKGLIYVTKFLIPNFIKQKKGTIINLGSIAKMVGRALAKRKIFT